MDPDLAAESSFRHTHEDRCHQGRSNKAVARILEHQFLPDGLDEEDRFAAPRRLVQEALRLAGVEGFEPSPDLLKAFLDAHDADGDGRLGHKDLEDRVGCYAAPDTSYVSNTRSTRSVPVSASDRGVLRRTAHEKVGDKISEALASECRKRFDRFDKAGEGFIEYEHLVPLITDVYSFIGVNFKPSAQDARKYVEVIDADRDGVISWEDFELFFLKIVNTLESQTPLS